MTNLFAIARTALLPGLLALLLPSCRQQHAEDEPGQSAEHQVVVTVKTAPVREGAATLTVTAFGRTDALKMEKLYAPLAGRIASLRAYEGTAVQAGDVIALIETRESESAVRGAELMLRMAETPARKAEAEQMLRLARTARTNVAVKASFDGSVSTRNVSEGELVAENAELATLVDLSTVGFVADVQLGDLPSVSLGQHASVTFQAWPDRHLPAVVDAINPQTDSQSQTVRVRLRFLHSSLTSGRATLRTEMNGSATIVTGERPHVLLIPKAALLRNDEDNTYWVVRVTPDSLTVKVPVEVGITTDSTAEIRGPGIRKGVLVITEGHYALSDSTRVTIPH